MKSLFTSLVLAAALSLGACTSTPMTPAQVQADVQAAALVINQGACDAQAAANIATASLTAAGDTAGAAQTAKVSAVAGVSCMALAAK
jgi:hypothetical protein